jgi:hypothetical protein
MGSLTQDQIRKRVLYVGDRSSFGVSLGFGIILLLFLLFNTYQISFIDFPLLYWLFILIAIITFFTYVAINQEFYYSFSVILNPNFILVQIIWVSFLTFVAGCLEPYYGWQQIIDVTLIYLLMYFTGYILGRIIWGPWKTMSGAVKAGLILSTLVIFGVVFLILGLNIISAGDLHWGVLMITYGYGTLFVIAITVLMYVLYIDKSGNDVWEDPPSMLIVIGMINTMIINFIVWFLLVLMVPLMGGGGGGSKKKGSSSKGSGYKSKRRSTRTYHSRYYYGYRRRTYILMGSRVLNHPQATVGEYWEAAMGNKEKLVEVDAGDVDKAKKKIIETLMDEGAVPKYKDLLRIVDAEPLAFDLALRELMKDKQVKFNSKTYDEWWTNGYSLAGEKEKELKEKLKDIDTAKVDAEFQTQVDKFLAAVKEQQPVKNRKALFDLAYEIGMRPLWKINHKINELMKQKKLNYKRKRPFGWYVS